MKTIEKKISSEVKQIVADYFSKKKEGTNLSTKWVTTQIKSKIGEIGDKLGYKVASSDHSGEWLYDLIWFTEDEKNNMVNVPLVLESEISDRNIAGIKFDFEKLLISKSKLKVFICLAEPNYNYPTSVQNIKNILLENFEANQMQISNDRILVLIWDDYNTGEIYENVFVK